MEILRLETGGHLHRDHRQELEHVVLEHVLEGAGSVVVAGPALERERATGPRLRCCCSPGLVHDEGRAMSLVCDALADAADCADAVDAA